MENLYHPFIRKIYKDVMQIAVYRGGIRYLPLESLYYDTRFITMSGNPEIMSFKDLRNKIKPPHVRVFTVVRECYFEPYQIPVYVCGTNSYTIYMLDMVQNETIFIDDPNNPILPVFHRKNAVPALWQIEHLITEFKSCIIMGRESCPLPADAKRLNTPESPLDYYTTMNEYLIKQNNYITGGVV